MEALLYAPAVREEWLLVSDAAAELGLTRWAIWALMKDGRLPWEYFGRFRVVRRDDVDRLKAERAETIDPTKPRAGRPRGSKKQD
jgi:hypothetical protein